MIIIKDYKLDYKSWSPPHPSRQEYRHDLQIRAARFSPCFKFIVVDECDDKSNSPPDNRREEQNDGIELETLSQEKKEKVGIQTRTCRSMYKIQK